MSLKNYSNHITYYMVYVTWNDLWVEYLLREALFIVLTLFKMGLFGAVHGCGAKRPPFWNPTHISYKDETRTVIPYLKKIQKKSIMWHTSLFLLPSAFFHWSSATFVLLRTTDINCSFINNFCFY